jgi:hypothetical protein
MDFQSTDCRSLATRRRDVLESETEVTPVRAALVQHPGIIVMA